MQNQLIGRWLPRLAFALFSLLLVNSCTQIIHQYPARIVQPRISLYEVQSTCPGTVSRLDWSFLLGDGWCFYLLQPNPPTPNYRFMFSARLRNRDGYGIWFRGSWASERVSAFGVQYDPGAGGIKFLNYPETEVDYFPRLMIHTDNQWHEWELAGTGDQVSVLFDGRVILQRSIPPMGTQLGFRTWRGMVDIRDIAIEYE